MLKLERVSNSSYSPSLRSWRDTGTKSRLPPAALNDGVPAPSLPNRIRGVLAGRSFRPNRQMPIRSYDCAEPGPVPGSTLCWRIAARQGVCLACFRTDLASKRDFQ